jgi:hypothetical protein
MHARSVLAETCLLQSWPDVPASREDRTLSPDFWREQVRKQLGIDPNELADTAPHASRPGELADVLAGLPDS